MQDRLRPNDETNTEALEHAVLDVMLQLPRPWSEAELGRHIVQPGDIPTALSSLSDAGLINRCDGFAAASYAAIRIFGINHDDDPCSTHEHRHEYAVLELLLATNDGETPMSRKEVCRELGARKQKRLDIQDAIDRLDAAGLLESVGNLLFPSRAALRFDHLST
ncbi:MAG TPA: hypothetical protein VMF09_07490 [Solirubrobacteraceae bacterium]|nr:hypothetical protein [Solirubrobacteraceae bacterium]